jgi:hypothetical protein
MTQQELLQRLPQSVTIEGDFTRKTVFVDDGLLNLKRSLKVRNHSPTGFNWGYGGSGPAQFALALLLKYLPEEEATRYYQKFKFEWVASLPQTDFEQTINLRSIMEKIINS